MYINDLNSTYLYERERRTDEMQIAQQSQILPFKRKNKPKELPMLIVLVTSIIVWLIL